MMKLNERYTLTAPQGTISETGMQAITRYINEQRLRDGEWAELNPGINRYALPTLPAEWNWVWVVTGRAEYVGTMPKRVGKFYHKQGIKCPASFLSQIGNIARQHTEDNLVYRFDFTDTFTWNAGDFGDRGSCFWGGRREALAMMHANDGLAIRFYDENGNGFGRGWIAPLANNTYIVFNGYGFTYGTLTCARVLAMHLNMSYKRISLENNGSSTGTLYINGGYGYMVGAAHDIEDARYCDLGWYDEYAYICYDCERRISDDETYWGLDDEPYCNDCFYEHYTRCEWCGETVYRDEVYWVDDAYEELCERCYGLRYTRCHDCDRDILRTNAQTHEGHTYCPECYAFQTKSK